MSRDYSPEGRGPLWVAVAFLIAAGLLLAALAFGGVLQTQTSPNGQWRVELADLDKPTVIELYATPAVGGVRRKISGPMPADYDISDFEISPDSTRVVYRKGRTALGDWALYSTPISGWNPAALSTGLAFVERLVSDGYVVNGPDVHLKASKLAGGALEVYAVPIMGGAPRGVPVFADGFNDGTTGGWTR
jgi:hypothetical protein